jgi:hypothetical protein
MDQASCSSLLTLHCALELSKNRWVLAIQFADREQPSLYPIQVGDTEKLMAKLAAARDCLSRQACEVVSGNSGGSHPSWQE